MVLMALTNQHAHGQNYGIGLSHFHGCLLYILAYSLLDYAYGWRYCSLALALPALQTNLGPSEHMTPNGTVCLPCLLSYLCFICIFYMIMNLGMASKFSIK